MSDPPPEPQRLETLFTGKRLADERLMISLPISVFASMQDAEREYWTARNELKVPPALTIEEHIRQHWRPIHRKYKDDG